VKINATLVNPFVEAALGVMKEVVGIEARRGQLSYRGRPEHRHGVSVIIWVYGYLSGQVIFNMKTEVAEKLIEKMFADKPQYTKTRLFSDAIGELANTITEKAAFLLSEGKDRALKISTPTVVKGDQPGGTLVSKPTLVLGLHTECGRMEINVALGEGGETADNGEVQEQGRGQ
jgi:CheY-specific phosphatase CheX